MGKLVLVNLGKKCLLSPAPLSSCWSSRNLSGKSLRGDVQKPKPFPYWEKEFNLWHAWYDKCTARFDENTKLVVVDGAHGVGKTKFAKELAEELDLLYMPEANMDAVYKSAYEGIDLRDYKDLFLPRVKPYDEKDFMRNPTGPVEGCADRFLYYLYVAKFKSHVMALRHIFNTGQGVVMEKSPFSHYAYVEAAYNQGWIHPTTRKFLNRVMHKSSLPWLLRPNLIIYLDASVEQVQKKMKEQGNEWDKNSPVLSTPHLTDLYTTMKRGYLTGTKKHSQVLVYDWAEPGETEVVVEDIERLNLDFYGQYEEQQKDWRLYNEEYAVEFRLRYSRGAEYRRMMGALSGSGVDLDAEQVFYTPEEFENILTVCPHIPGFRYMYGYNSDMGDKNLMFKTMKRKVLELKDPIFPVHFGAALPWWVTPMESRVDMSLNK